MRPLNTLAFPSTTAHPAHSSITSTHTHAFLNAHLKVLAHIITPQHSSFPAHPESLNIHTGFGSGASVAARCCSCNAACRRRCGCRCCRLSSPGFYACWRCPMTPPRPRRRAHLQPANVHAFLSQGGSWRSRGGPGHRHPETATPGTSNLEHQGTANPLHFVSSL